MSADADVTWTATSSVAATVTTARRSTDVIAASATDVVASVGQQAASPVLSREIGRERRVRDDLFAAGATHRTLTQSVKPAAATTASLTGMSVLSDYAMIPRPSGCQQDGTVHVSGPLWNETPVVGFKQFCTIFPHISAAYLVFTRSAYYFFLQNSA